jgi:hypothetical protein
VKKGEESEEKSRDNAIDERRGEKTRKSSKLIAYIGASVYICTAVQ